MVWLDNNNKNEFFIKSEKLKIIYFTAEWCGPCKQLKPIMEEISSENNQIEIGRIDVDQLPDLTEKFAIMSVPTLIFIKNGKQILKNIGMIHKQKLENKINELL